MDLRRRCAKCGDLLNLDNMRALPGGTKFVCKACEEQKTPDFLGRRDLRKPIVQKTDTRIPKENVEFEKKEYICLDCKYQFKRNPEFLVSKCPMCGKSRVQQKIEENADEFLRD